MENIRGLTEEEVVERRKSGQANEKVKSSTMTVGSIIRSNVFTYFNLIFAMLAVLLAGVRAWRDMFFLFVIFFNTMIGIVQEIHSKKVLDKLKLLEIPYVRVIRDAKEISIPAEELVQDDVVILSAGNQIPADALVLWGQVNVNEALMTGEADEIVKKQGDELMSGSFIVSGEVCARLIKVGRESYINQLTLQATKTKRGEQSEMIRSLNRLIQLVGIVIIPVGGLLFYQSFVVNHGGLRGSITGMVAAVIGMIPEGLYLLASVAMAASTARLANRRVLVHDMKCIETLARVDVLCVDKTGTITQPGMKVWKFEPVENAYAEGENQKSGSRNLAADREPGLVGKRLGDLVGALSADNHTMEALKEYFTEKTGAAVSEIFSFSSKTKYSGAVIDGKSYVLGAPERVLRQQLSGRIRTQIEEFSAQGFRVLAFAEYMGKLENLPLTEEVRFLGLVLLSNPIREGAKETFSYFEENDVSIKVISGDHPLTVSVVAQAAGIAGAERYIDAAELVSEQDYDEAVKKYTVFGRVAPEQKRHLVKAFQKQGHTVAMTGDGVNDVLALKDADCSVAMASGAQAASNVAQLVLMDSEFSRMPDVVTEGRRVVNNIQRTASLYLVKNIFSLLTAVFSVLFVMDYPMEPPQVSLVAMFTIGAPSFFLALEPNRSRITGKFLPNVLKRALPAGIADFILVAGWAGIAGRISLARGPMSTIAAMLLALVGFGMLIYTARPMNRWHVVLVAAMLAGMIGCMLFIPWFFGITPLSVLFSD